MPPSVQTSYPTDYTPLVAGQIADTQTCDVDSRKLTGAAAVPFGFAVQPGDGDREVARGVARPQLALLDAALNNSATSLSFDTFTAGRGGFRVGQHLLVGSEIMLVSAVAADLTVVRGVLGSSAASHADDDPIYAFDEVLFAGVAVMDERLPAADGPNFTAGQTMPVLHRGDIAVQVSAAVSADDQVVATVTTSGTDLAGSFSSRAPDARHVVIPNARFVTSAAANGIAVLRIGGVTPTFA